MAADPKTAEQLEAAPPPVLVPVAPPPASVEKHQRRQELKITVRYDERHLPPDVLLKLFTLRQEINNLNKAQKAANETIKRLRAEGRLHARVMRLKTEARLDGRAALMNELSSCAEKRTLPPA